MNPNPSFDPNALPMDASDREILITRTFKAPRELIWKVFTEPQHMMRWWGGKGFTTPVCEVDLRVGGVWYYVMRAPDGKEFPIRQVYHEITKPERIVYGAVEVDSELPQPIHTMIFEEQDGQTKVTLHSLIPTAAERDQMINYGFAKTVTEGLDKLADYIQTL